MNHLTCAKSPKIDDRRLVESRELWQRSKSKFVTDGSIIYEQTLMDLDFVHFSGQFSQSLDSGLFRDRESRLENAAFAISNSRTLMNMDQEIAKIGQKNV